VEEIVEREPYAPEVQFKREVEKELTGRESEPWEIIYFKLYKTQIPIVEQAIETAALMLGTDKSRGYCLEMICADFLAGRTSKMGTQHCFCSPFRGSSNFFQVNRGRLFCKK
jgi:hypothetical protein